MLVTAFDNVLKRNSGYGVLVSTTLPRTDDVTVAGNVLVANSAGGISATGAGASVIVSANTAYDSIVCANNATLAAYGNNASRSILSSSGCIVASFGLH